MEFASRIRSLALVVCLGLFAVSLAAPPSAWAQGLERKSDAPSPGSAEARFDPVAPEGDAAVAESVDEGGESFLAWMIRASGYIGLLIALMSFYLIALVVWMSLHYRTPVVAPAGLVEEVGELLDRAKYNDAYQRLAEDESFLARVLAAGVRKLPGGLEQGRRAMELVNEDVTMQMEHRTTYLATVGTLGPMIGLVGTVYGMIKAFQVIARAGASPQASDLASGISTALFATLEGIAISIPAIYFYAMFRNRIARLSLEVGMLADPMLERFAPGVRMAGPGPAAAPTPPPPPAPASHAHPFAVSAAIAAGSAASGVGPGRPALPPVEPSPAGD